MRTIAVFLVCLTAAMDAQASSQQEAFERCYAFKGKEINVNMKPSQLKKIIAENKAAKKAACADAEAIIEKRNEAQNRMDAAIRAFNREAVLRPAIELYAQVDAQTKKLLEGIRGLEKITTEIGEANNAIFSHARATLDESRGAARNWRTNWNELHRGPAGGPLAELEELLDDSYLSEDSKQSIRGFLNSLPPYVSGRGSAPTERLDRLDSLIFDAERAIERKNRYYTSVFRKELQGNIDKVIEPQVLKIKARKYYLTLAKPALTPDPVVASAATRARGSCLRAQEYLDGALRWIESVYSTAPEVIRAQVKEEAATDESRLRSKIQSSYACDFNVHTPRIKKAIEEILPLASNEKCLSKSKSLKDSSLLASRNWRSMSAVDASVQQRHAEFYHLNLEKIYSDLEFVKSGCEKVEKL